MLPQTRQAFDWRLLLRAIEAESLVRLRQVALGDQICQLLPEEKRRLPKESHYGFGVQLRRSVIPRLHRFIAAKIDNGSS
jgi:hypothetical protein